MIKSGFFWRLLLTVVVVVCSYAVLVYVLMLQPLQHTAATAEEGAALALLDAVSAVVEDEVRILDAEQERGLELRRDTLRNAVQMVESYLAGHAKSLSRSRQDQELLQQQLLQAVRSFRFGENGYVWVSNYDARILSHPDPLFQGADLSQAQDLRGDVAARELIQQVRSRGEAFGTYAATDPASGKEIERLLYGRNYSRFSWILGASVALEDPEVTAERLQKRLFAKLQTLVQELRIGDAGYVFLFDKDMQMVAHPDEQLQGASGSHLTSPELEEPLLAAFMRVAQEGGGPVAHRIDTRNHIPAEGEALTWVQPIESMQWYVAATAYTQELDRPALKARKRLLWVSVVAAAATLFLGGLALRSVVGPIRRLVNTARRVQAGDYEVRCPVAGGGDTRLLIRTFNSMMDRVHASVQYLGAQAEEAEQALANASEKLHTVAESIPMAVAHVDGKGRIVYANNALQRLTGFSSAELATAQGFLNRVTADAQGKALLESVMAGEAEPESQERPWLFQSKSGEYILVAVQAAVLSDGGRLLLVEDVTRRTELELLLREREARYKLLLEAGEDPIVVYTRDKRIKYVNRAFEKVYGWNRDELAKQPIHFVPLEEAEANRRAMEKAIAGERVVFTTKRMTRNGGILPVKLTAAGLYTDEGQFEGVYIIHRILQS